MINCQLLREVFCASQIVSIANFVVVSSVGIMRVDCMIPRRTNKEELQQRNRHGTVGALGSVDIQSD